MEESTWIEMKLLNESTTTSTTTPNPKQKPVEKDTVNQLPILAIALVGTGCAGKSSLLHRFLKGSFERDIGLRPTMCVDFKLKVLSDPAVRCHFFDFQGVRRMLYEGPLCAMMRTAPCALVVYDITSRRSFEELDEWLDVLESSSPPAGRPVRVLVGNKLDLESDSMREVPTEEGRALAVSRGMDFVETSAKDGTKVEEMFMTAIRKAQIFARYPKIESTQKKTPGCSLS